MSYLGNSSPVCEQEVVILEASANDLRYKLRRRLTISFAHFFSLNNSDSGNCWFHANLI